jgi:hypothetical protein
MRIVIAVWFIIGGGVIIFIDGDLGCISCNGILSTVVGAIGILLGVVGPVSKFTTNQTVARE